MQKRKKPSVNSYKLINIEPEENRKYLNYGDFYIDIEVLNIKIREYISIASIKILKTLSKKVLNQQ
jgi:hypothetical protein